MLCHSGSYQHAADRPQTSRPVAALATHAPSPVLTSEQTRTRSFGH
jgi:hypothetical protein